MKKIILFFGLIIVFALYVLLSSPKNTPSQSTTATSQTIIPAVVKNTGKYRDGTYNGSVADAYYGNVEVSATISGGKLTDVQFLQYPNDRGNSIRINTRAMPLLKSEAITAQSAVVNGVSGATATSGAFKQSLGVALSLAAK
ncbi:MAG: FMN-binding protein [Candidatus Taylorbacteria bacterium]